MITGWTERFRGNRVRDPLLLSAAQFSHAITSERMRAVRRAFPFCVITIDLDLSRDRRRRTHKLVRILTQHLRATDQKGTLGGGRFGVLLTDTPEMGGRSAMDRLSQLTQKHGLPVSLHLRVHDPEGFGSDNESGSSSSGGGMHAPVLVGSKDRRGANVDDDESRPWVSSDGNVDVTSEDPMVPRPMMQSVAKRSLDVVGSSLGLIVTGPIILAAMAAIRWQDGQSPLFRQTREGQRGKPFTIYKLRTMVVNAEASQEQLRSQSHRDGPAFKISNDPRVTPIGQFLRKTCIDELPQLWNVLKGDMSLVGPRPLPWHESRACVAWHRRRLDVRPGMTCYWQVEKGNVESFDDWMRLDLRYLANVSLSEDLRLIARTVAVPVTGRGSE